MPDYENISNLATKLLIIYNTHNTSQNIFFKLPQQPLTARNPALLPPQSPWQEPQHRMTLTHRGGPVAARGHRVQEKRGRQGWLCRGSRHGHGHRQARNGSRHGHHQARAAPSGACLASRGGSARTTARGDRELPSQRGRCRPSRGCCRRRCRAR